MKNKHETLVVGIGNPGRMDDGLGPGFIEQLEQKKFTAGDLEYRYQLQIEDALLFSCYQRVIIVDASRRDIEHFSFSPIKSKRISQFSTHAVNAETVLALCEEMYDVVPATYLFEIKGFEWDLGNDLSSRGRESLLLAVQYFYSDKCRLWPDEWFWPGARDLRVSQIAGR